MYEFCTSLQTNSIEFGLEWKDTLVVMDTALEPSCSNNAMQLDTLVRRERSVKYQDIGSGVLEARNIGVLLVKILFVDCLPGLLMNLLSLSRITKQTSCELNYKEAQIEFVLRATGEHKLMFTLLSNFYLCDMATSVFRSNEAKVKDAVKLFTLSYLTSAVWMSFLDLVDLDLVILGLAVLDLVILDLAVLDLSFLDLADLDLVISDLVIFSLAILEFMLWIWTITTIC